MTTIAAAPPPPGPTVDLMTARAALAAVTPRTAALVAGIDDPGRHAAGLDWTLAETAAHLLVALRAYTASVRGDIGEWAAYLPETELYGERLPAVTAATLDAVPSRDPAVLGAELTDAVADFLRATDGRSATEVVPTPWYGSATAIPLGAATCLLLGEQLIHGRDIAATIGQPWTITREQALLLVPVFAAMMPLVADPAAVRGVRAVYALHLRGGPGLVLRVDGGGVTVEPAGTQRVDCHLSADPVLLALVGYGRISQWAAIARGGLVPWGRRPWLGLRFRGLFANP